MKKLGIYSVIGLIVIGLTASYVSAAPIAAPACPNQHQLNFTDEQKQELAPLYQQMLETKKQIMQKYVSYGTMTQEQADQHTVRMQSRADNGSMGYMGMGHGGKGNGSGHGCKGQQNNK